MSNKKISLIVPVFNEEDSIEVFINHVIPILNSLSINYEIIFIDDGSTDSTLDQLIKQASLHQSIRVIEFSRNFGKEAALSAGLFEADGEAMIPIDVDLQDPPELIPGMLEKWHQGAEVVLAKRTHRANDSIHKRLTASLFYRVHNYLSGVKIPINVGDYRLMDRAVVEALKLLPEQQRFMKGLFAWLGFKTVVIEYERTSRKEGISKYSTWKLWNLALEAITSFSSAPLKFWSYIGALGAFFSICYAAFILIRTLIYGIDIPGYASLTLLILFFGSLQLISIGFLGEYISRIYIETKHRPLYIIRKKHGYK